MKGPEAKVTLLTPVHLDVRGQRDIASPALIAISLQTIYGVDMITCHVTMSDRIFELLSSDSSDLVARVLATLQL